MCLYAEFQTRLKQKPYAIDINFIINCIWCTKKINKTLQISVVIFIVLDKSDTAELVV